MSLADWIGVVATLLFVLFLVWAGVAWLVSVWPEARELFQERRRLQALRDEWGREMMEESKRRAIRERERKRQRELDRQSGEKWEELHKLISEKREEVRKQVMERKEERRKERRRQEGTGRKIVEKRR